MTNLLKKSLLLMAVLYAQFAAAQTHADAFSAMQIGEWDKAITIYTALTKANATDQTAFLSLGNAYLMKGDKTKAKESFDAAFAAKSEGNYAIIANARNLLLQNNISAANEQFKRAFGKSKKDAVAMRQIGESYLYFTPQGSVRPDFTQAEKWLKDAADVNNKDFNTLMSLGYCYKEMPNGGEAARTYQLAEALEPKNPVVKYMLAKVYKFGKVFDRYVDYLNRTIAVAPTYTPALRSKAEYYYFGHKWEEATAAYKELVAKGAEAKIEDEMQLANCLFITKDCKGVSELVESILKRDGTKNYLRRLLAYCSYENAQYDQGMAIMNEYFKKVTPDKVLASDYFYLGKLQMATKGDTIVAISNLRKSIELDSASWPLYKPLGETYYGRKDYCNAALMYKMYLDSLPESNVEIANDFYKYGLAQYYCKGEPDSIRYGKAEVIFARVAALRPKAPIGWLWAAKSAAKFDPSVEQITAQPEMANKYGRARSYYEKYVEVAGADKEKNKKELLTAYNYLAYCYFVKVEADKFNDITAKWLDLEMDPASQQTIRDMQAAFGKDVPAAPATPATPGSSGGGKNK